SGRDTRDALDLLERDLGSALFALHHELSAVGAGGDDAVIPAAVTPLHGKTELARHRAHRRPLDAERAHVVRLQGEDAEFERDDVAAQAIAVAQHDDVGLVAGITPGEAAGDDTREQQEDRSGGAELASANHRERAAGPVLTTALRWPSPTPAP